MYNLIVKASPWAEGRDTLPASRAFEYTAKHLIERFSAAGNPNFASLATLPTLFVEEAYDKEDQIVRIGILTSAKISGRQIALDYVYDPAFPVMTNAVLRTIAPELDIEDFEFVRTHWAIKDTDLFRVLLRNMQPRRKQPKVFQLSDPENIEHILVSAMMPFHPSFDAVYSTLQETAKAVGFRCRRADDIWENPAVIQDVVSLIDRSNIVICDCTGRNANVFYEIGIAHTLGREVILITQSKADIPFDLRHLRYIHYLNNGEGLRALSERLQPRLAAFA